MSNTFKYPFIEITGSISLSQKHFNVNKGSIQFDDNSFHQEFHFFFNSLKKIQPEPNKLMKKKTKADNEKRVDCLESKVVYLKINTHSNVTKYLKYIW